MLGLNEIQDPLFRAMMLMATFWTGFSLIFVVLLLCKQLSAESTTEKDEHYFVYFSPIKPHVRIIASIVLLSGVFGAAPLLGLTSRFQIDGGPAALLSGLVVGIWLNYKLFKKWNGPR
jgi:hypothetical protein